LLSDVLGLSILVDSIDHPKPPNSTEGTVLGPFHADAPEISHGDVISFDPNGEPMLVLCTLKDTSGRPIEGAKIDIWESDTTGHYDVQYSDRGMPDGRCVVHSDGDGIFWFKAIKPVPYPVPCDGPVGRLLERIHRHPFRPSHVHFMFEKEGYDHLITYVYVYVKLQISTTKTYITFAGASSFAMTPMRPPTLSSESKIPLSLTLEKSTPTSRPSMASTKAPGL
jgi:protocatechuate 3,4-dioxygenase beta subunit